MDFPLSVRSTIEMNMDYINDTKCKRPWFGLDYLPKEIYDLARNLDSNSWCKRHAHTIYLHRSQNAQAIPAILQYTDNGHPMKDKSKIYEELGRCGRPNMLRPYLKIWDWDWIIGRAVKAISSLGVRSPCCSIYSLNFGNVAGTQDNGNLTKYGD